MYIKVRVYLYQGYLCLCLRKVALSALIAAVELKIREQRLYRQRAWDDAYSRIKEDVFLLKARRKRSSYYSSSTEAVSATDIISVLGYYVRSKVRRCNSIGTRLAYQHVVFRIEDE